MDFRFTEEQIMIRETASSFFASHSDILSVRESMETDSGYSSSLWSQICDDLYLHAITIPESIGGMGLGYVELIAVMEQMGRHLVCAPYFSTVCLAIPALHLAGCENQSRPWLEHILDGKTATMAWIGQEAFGCNAVTATYEISDEGFRLSGDYHFVIDGHTADIIVLAARSPGSVGREGISLFVVSSENIVAQWTPTLDQTRHVAKVRLENFELSGDACLGNEGQAGLILEKVLQLASIALAAEQVGVAQKLQDMSVQYTKEREQFGRPIASFQAIKHKAADMMLRTEVARSACYYAACIADEAWRNSTLSAELPEAASIAKSYCSDACFNNAGEAIQMHGGVGFTWEYDVHLYFKRAKASQLMLGTSTEHLENIASQLLKNHQSKQSFAEIGAAE